MAMNHTGQMLQPPRLLQYSQPKCPRISSPNPQLDCWDLIFRETNTISSPHFSYPPPNIFAGHNPEHSTCTQSQTSTAVDSKVGSDLEERCIRQKTYATLLHGGVDHSTQNIDTETYMAPRDTLFGPSTCPPFDQLPPVTTLPLPSAMPSIPQQYAYDGNGMRHHNGLPAAGGYISPPETPRYEDLPGSPFASGDGFTSDIDSDGKSDQVPYAQLIYRALRGAPGHRMILKDIYKWVKDHSDRADDPTSTGWQNSIRHNLSMNKAFLKIPYESNDGKRNKGGYIWVLSDDAIKFGGVLPTTRFRNQEIKNRATTRKNGSRNKRLTRLGRRGGRQAIKSECIVPTSSPYRPQNCFEVDSAMSSAYQDGLVSTMTSTNFYPAEEPWSTNYPCPTPAPSPDGYGTSFEPFYKLPTASHVDMEPWYDYYGPDLHFSSTTGFLSPCTERGDLEDS